MGINNNPRVNLAGARIGWDQDTGDMIIESQYGFEFIYKLPTGGVLFVLEEDSADENTFTVATPTYSDGLSTAQYVPVVGCAQTAPSEGGPYHTNGKRGIRVDMWSIQPLDNIGFDLIPFTILVQDLSPGYITPEEGMSLCPIRYTVRQTVARLRGIPDSKQN